MDGYQINSHHYLTQSYSIDAQTPSHRLSVPPAAAAASSSFPSPTFVPSVNQSSNRSSQVPASCFPLPPKASVGATTPASTAAPPRRNTTTGHNLSAPTTYMSAPLRPPTDNSHYLHFFPPVQDTPVYDARNCESSIGLTAQLSGQFSLSPALASGSSSSFSADESMHENVSTPEPKTSPHTNTSISPEKSTPIRIVAQPAEYTHTNDSTNNISPATSDNSLQASSPQLELIFYRRNLFQISCIVTNARNAVYAGCSDSPTNPAAASSSTLRPRILGFSMEVSVSGTDESKKPKLLYTPPKADSTNSKEEQNPAVKPLCPRDSAQGEVVDWKRLQFRSATAHNGRRRLQNYYTLTVALFAELDNRQRVRLVYAQSHPIVVRGRNPQFYRNRMTIAITGTDHSFSRMESLPSVKEEHKSPSSDEDEDLHNSPFRDDDDSDDSVTTKKPKVEDDDDGLYEYFPMPSNYYEPPVEVVYRPHAITHVPSVIQTSSMKRAFAATA